MTINELIIKLASFKKPDAVVVMSAENESGDCFDGFVSDVHDISFETDGDTVCIVSDKRD